MSVVESLTQTCGPLNTQVSFGTDIRKPTELVTRSTGDLLDGVRAGEWQSAVSCVRDLPIDSGAQREVKNKLPFMLWSGEFSRRNSRSLLKHSGIIGIDLDSLAAPETRRVMHCALDDPHCLAAYRSASGHGVRLLVRVHPTAAENHKFVFESAAAHVRIRYAVEPDPSGSDVSRASFVSWDGGLWINPQATIVPVQIHPANTMVPDHCVRFPGVPWWIWLAREFMPHRTREDGTASTHHVLLQMGGRIAMRSFREKLWLREEFVDSASDAWLEEVRRRGIRLRGEPENYRAELWRIVSDVQKCEWFPNAAERWTRWTRVSGCPSEPRERILFAIRRHCESAGTREFFLSSRDAGAIGGIRHVRASELLRDLSAQGFIRRTGKRRAARQAITYELLQDFTK